MSNHEFENYLALVSRLLRLTRCQKDSIRDELYDHLETRISELVESGTDANQATRRALEEFGDAAVLAQKFQSVFQFNRRRWMMRFATFSIAATFLATVLIMAMWPDQARFGAPTHSIAQDSEPFGGSDSSNPFGAETADSSLAATRDHQQDNQSVLTGPETADSSLAATETIASPAAKPRARIWGTEDIERKLEEPSSLDYDENTFQEVMDEIRDEHGFNVMLDQSARDDSLDQDTLITFNIQNVRLSTALRLMLKEHNASYCIEDGILRIISLDSASEPEFFRLKMFECRQLLDKIARNDDSVGKPSHTDGHAATGGFTGAAKDRFVCGGVVSLQSQQPSELMGQTAPAENADERAKETDVTPPPAEAAAVQPFVSVVTPESLLTQLVRTSVSPDSWVDSGDGSTLVIVGGVMVVNSSQRELEEIESLLQELSGRLK